jgi:Fe2+ transport system protein FeoA
MGVVPGAPVRVIKTAPLGDPIEVRVRGYNLALRRTEAQTISVIGDEG